MAPALEAGAQERRDDPVRLLGCQACAAERDHVGVVVATGHLGLRRVVRVDGAHAGEASKNGSGVSGGPPGSGSTRQAASPAVASQAATPRGTDLSGASIPWVASSCLMKSRKTCGSPSVTK